MQARASKKTVLEFRTLSSKCWTDLETLFGEHGACGGCWCMLWRLTRAEFEKQKGNKNRRAMKKLVDAGKPCGILAYLDKQPVGWCALAPRQDYPALARSRVLQPVDDQPVWSIACLFIHRSHRQRGISVELLKAVIEHVRKRGGRIVEGYPVEPKKENMPDVFAWTGIASAFLAAGFWEVARRSETRPIMRFNIPA